MSRLSQSNWVRLVLLKSLLIFSVSAGADVHQFDRDHGRGGQNGDNNGGANGSIGGGPREGGGHNGGDHGGNNGGGRGGNDDHGGWDHGGGNNDHGNGGRGGNDHGGGWGDHGGGRGGHNGGGPRRPDPNPYDPNRPDYPPTPCQRDPRNCGNGGNNGGNGGWGETQRAIYVNQVFQNQYVDLAYLAGGILNGMQGYGLTGVDVEVVNAWGPTTLTLAVNGALVDTQQVYERYVQLNSYQAIDLFYGNRVNLGVQGRVQVGQIVLHFSPLGRR